VINNWKRKTAALAAGLLAAGSITACSSQSEKQEPAASSATAAASPAASTAATPAQPAKLKLWHPLNANAAAVVKNLGDLPMMQEWQKRTNVEFEFLHPAGTNSQDINQQLGVLLASNNLPDLMVWYWGNTNQLYQDGVIIDLKDLIDQHAPNLKKLLKENPAVEKQIKSDTGEILVFPHLRTGQYGQFKTFSGMMIRQDWLDELGLKSPETIDEWETVLRAFKEKKGAIPFTSSKDTLFGAGGSKDFMGAYGIGQNFYHDNGVIKYGPLQPAFKDYLAKMSAWYKEGLIDPDFATNDGKAKDAKITSGKAGSFYGFIGGSLGNLTPSLQKNEPGGKLTAVQYPVLNKGDEPQFTVSTWDYVSIGAVITKSNKNPVATIKALDYLYSEEGSLLKNFGIEGQTYTMVNGQPTYTDLILKNPDKLSVGHAMAKHFIANYEFVGPDDDRYNQQYYTLQEQKDALNVYSKYAANTYKHILPPMSSSSSDSQEMSKIMADIDTYRTEVTTKIIMGSAPLESWDAAVEQFKKMKIERAIEIQQKGLDNYSKR
jgi:putative aldouronate transport system substrate-binding protein